MHARFSTNPHWAEWLFEREAPEPGARILEVGCGPAQMWRMNLERIDPTWSLTLTDFSPGMIDAARAVLGDRATYAVCNAEVLPFADESFDVVLANHMLYHVEDRQKAFAEFKRVLGPRGILHAATNGHAHMRELRELVGVSWPFHRHTEDFGLETGLAQLARFFTDVVVERFEDDLEVTEVEPVLAYVRSSSVYDGGTLEHVRDAVAAAIERDGLFRIEKSQGLISCRRP